LLSPGDHVIVEILHDHDKSWLRILLVHVDNYGVRDRDHQVSRVHELEVVHLLGSWSYYYVAVQTLEALSVGVTLSREEKRLNLVLACLRDLALESNEVFVNSGNISQLLLGRCLNRAISNGRQVNRE